MANAWVMRPLPMTLSSADTAAGHDAGYAANDYLGVTWKAAATAEPVLSIDLGKAVAVDAILLFAVGGTATHLQVRASNDSTFASGVHDSGLIPLLAGAEMPTHGLGVGWWTSAAALEYRYWQLRFSAGGADVAPEIGRVTIGKRIELARNYSFGGGWGVRDLGAVEFGRYGNLLRRRGAKMRGIGLTFSNVHKDEVEAAVQPLAELHGGQEPIVLVTDPEPHAMRQSRCWFGPLIGELGTIQRYVDAWEWRANLIDLVPVPAAGS